MKQKCDSLDIANVGSVFCLGKTLMALSCIFLGCHLNALENLSMWFFLFSSKKNSWRENVFLFVFFGILKGLSIFWRKLIQLFFFSKKKTEILVTCLADFPFSVTSCFNHFLAAFTTLLSFLLHSTIECSFSKHIKGLYISINLIFENVLDIKLK